MQDILTQRLFKMKYRIYDNKGDWAYLSTIEEVVQYLLKVLETNGIELKIEISFNLINRNLF